MKYRLDTNVLRDFARGERAAVARLRQEAPLRLAVSVITEMEVEYGLAPIPGLAPACAGSHAGSFGHYLRLAVRA